MRAMKGVCVRETDRQRGCVHVRVRCTVWCVCGDIFVAGTCTGVIMSVVVLGTLPPFSALGAWTGDTIVSGKPGDLELGICLGCQLKVTGWIEQSSEYNSL